MKELVAEIGPQFDAPCLTFDVISKHVHSDGRSTWPSK